jgi:hypothetical protein
LVVDAFALGELGEGVAAASGPEFVQPATISPTTAITPAVTVARMATRALVRRRGIGPLYE